MKRPRLHIGLTDALRMLPHFCWLSLDEVVAYAEQICETTEYPSVMPSLHLLVAKGEVDVRIVERVGPRRQGQSATCRLYKAVKWSASVKTNFRILIATDKARSARSDDLIRFMPNERRA